MDKEKLFSRRADETTATVPIGKLGDVTVRALSQGEVKKAQESEDYEALLLASAMVDPVLTPEEARHWLNTAPGGDPVAAMDKIGELSGLTEGARKSDVAGVRNRAARRVRTPSRGKTR